jgi:hypothetical protein
MEDKQFYDVCTVTPKFKNSLTTYLLESKYRVGQKANILNFTVFH